MFNKMEEMFSFLKSIATHGSQLVVEGGKNQMLLLIK
jgi:hypothetical protein